MATRFLGTDEIHSLDIGPGSYLNFGGELRERMEHFSRPFFGLTPRDTTTYDMHRLLLNGDLHIGDSFRTFIQLGNYEVTSPSMSWRQFDFGVLKDFLRKDELSQSAALLSRS
jgi:Alginate export